MDPILIIIIVAVLVIAAFFVLLFRNYKSCGPNEALIISGGRKRPITMPDGTVREIGYRYRIGGGTLVRPFMERTQILPLEIIPMDFNIEDAISTNGIRCRVRGTAEVKIAGDEPAIYLAAEQFLGKSLTDIRDVALRSLEGSCRALIGTMNLESLNKNRKQFAAKVFEDVESYFANMGVRLLSFNLKEITDPSGYLAALGKPRIVEAQRDAEVAEAEAARDAIIRSAQAKKEGDIAKLAAETEVAQATHSLQMRKAELQAELSIKKADADFSYELERNKINQILKSEEAKVKIIEKDSSIALERKEIERAEQELMAKVRKPADAEKYRLQAEAEGMAAAKKAQASAEAEALTKVGQAEADALKKKAEAWNAFSEPALLQLVFEKLPDLAKEMAAPLSKVDKIVMVSSDGKMGSAKITGEVASMLSQLPAVVKDLSGFDIQAWLQKLAEKSGQGSESK